MRFCMVTTFYPPYSFGGDAIFVRNLARELARRGHEVEVVHNVDAFLALGGAEPVAPLAEEGIRVHALRSRRPLLAALRMHQRGGAGPHAARLRELLERDFDVVHFHNVSLAGGPRVLELGRGVKLYSLHEWWLVCPTHTLFRFGRAACERPLCFACSLAHGRPPQLWRWSGALARATARIDAFLAPSRFSVEMHRRRGAELPLVHFPSFSPHLGDEPKETGAEAGSAAPRPYFLFVGRLERLKGPQTLIPHFRGRADAELVVAGSGGEEESLRAAARGAAVRFVGWRSGDELSRLYRGAVAVVLPSLCYDMFPLVAIEALQHGTPIVARDLGALSEIATESGGGLLYRDEAGLDAALARLLADRGLRDRLGSSGRAAYLARWTPENYLERYLTLIDEIGRRRGAPSAAD